LSNSARHDLQAGRGGEKSWRRLDGHSQFTKIILGVKFADGIEVIRPQSQPLAAIRRDAASDKS
jgi:hypothetical protein